MVEDGQNEVRNELEVGVVEHFYPRVNVAVVKVQNGVIHRGDRLHIVGRGVDLEETIRSIELNHQPIAIAHEGEEVGIQLSTRVRENDRVYVVRA